MGNGEKDKKKEGLTVSSIDFVGLNFSDKKSGRGLPAGLVPVIDPFPDADLPEVEIIVGDASKFQDATTSKPRTNVEENPDLYKPKVSTWGVFPRPSNISKTVIFLMLLFLAHAFVNFSDYKYIHREDWELSPALNGASGWP